MNARRGFTLIELLIALALATIVGGTVVAIFASGARLWEQFQQSDLREQWALVTLEEISRDLRNVCHFRLIPFEGTYEDVSFPLLMSSAEQPQTRELARAGFFLDARHDVLCRSRVPYAAAGRTRLRDICQPLAEGFSRVRFEYFGAETAGGTPRWMTSWKQPAPPLAVKIALSYEDATTKRAVTHTRIVHIPTSAAAP